ncbi:arginine--tRNA ligase [Candidatus Campbellbacteria bacterium]|nr:MAG: arginine--tRNA ligase [Candidatus Campbellbacteria bacterium]
MLEKALIQKITDACEALGYPPAVVVLERPAEMAHGDFACTVALALAKQVGENPRAVAEKIVQHLLSAQVEGVEKIEVAGPGFINFTLSRDFFVHELETILKQGTAYGTNETFSGKTIMVEYTQPNPFKPFHIGHLMSNTIGETLTRIFENAGARVIRANYQGDVGLHVAKALWGMMKRNVDPTDIPEIGKAYAYGHEMYETDETAQKEIVEINKKVYTHDTSVEDMYQKGREASLKAFEEIYALLGTRFDEYFFESQTLEAGRALVEEGLEKGIFQKSEGAIVFPGEVHGLHTRVFITKEGVLTYEGKELGLAVLKMDRCTFDESITITAVEQEQYFNVVFKALELLRPEFTGRFKHIHHGMMVLTTGKMSSRKGNVITGESLLQDMIHRAQEKVSERGVGTTDAIANAVAVGAIKYMVLKQGTEKNSTFDPERSLSFEGDSGPYIQYTLVRAKSILQKAAEAHIVGSCDGERPELSDFERMVSRFPEKTLLALRGYAPQYISQYVTELSGAFNAWYAQEKIVDTNNPHAPYKVALTKTLSTVLENGLHILGISTPEKM